MAEVRRTHEEMACEIVVAILQVEGAKNLGSPAGGWDAAALGAAIGTLYTEVLKAVREGRTRPAGGVARH